MIFCGIVLHSKMEESDEGIKIALQCATLACAFWLFGAYLLHGIIHESKTMSHSNQDTVFIQFFFGFLSIMAMIVFLIALAASIVAFQELRNLRRIASDPSSGSVSSYSTKV